MILTKQTSVLFIAKIVETFDHRVTRKHGKTKALKKGEKLRSTP